MRFILIDKVTKLNLGKSITGVKCITSTDDVMHDHFPGKPIMPGSLLVESAAQLSGMLLELSENQDESTPIRRSVLVQIEKMKFHEFSKPGDQLIINADIISKLPEAAKVRVAIKCENEMRVNGTLSFSLIELDTEEINKQRKMIYTLWTGELEQCPLIR
ncbi:MAG: 3-hydroxyacyl-ACP dehydratase FabZ family protein [Ignavibacteriaceae bacterium]